MLILNTLRTLSFAYFMFRLFAPPRFVLFFSSYLYYVFVVSCLLLSVIRIPKIHSHRGLTATTVIYTLIPFCITVYAYACQRELVQAVCSSFGLLWIIGPLFLPVLLFVEHVRDACAVKPM